MLKDYALDVETMPGENRRARSAIRAFTSYVIMKLVIATKNRHKIAEITGKLASGGSIQFLSLLDYANPPEIIEDSDTFAENAVIKAKAVCRFTGLPALADDSGLVVDALNGEPGVYSARYAGEGASDRERNLLVLRKMEHVPHEKRTARFVCVIAVALPDGTVYTTEGRCEGSILRAEKGEGGFGYDPIFFIPGRGKTMAELSMEEKNTLSHRAVALAQAEILLNTIVTSGN